MDEPEHSDQDQLNQEPSQASTSDTSQRTGQVPASAAGGSSGQVPEQGATGGQDPVMMTALLDAVTALTARVEILQSKVSQPQQESSHQVPTLNTSYRSDTLNQTSSIVDLSEHHTLNARLDTMLGGRLPRQPKATPEPQILQGPTATQDTGLLADFLTAASTGKGQKSPRDAPTRRIKSTVLWPNHFVTRSSTSFVKYDNLTLEEFVLGMVRIIRLPEISTVERAARLQHLENIMVSALVYQWGPVRSMYASALEAIQYGDLTWDFSYTALKERELHPGHLKVHSSDDQTSKPKDACRNWNYRVCERPDCPYQHICAACMAHYNEIKYHRAFECPRRKEYLQPSIQNQQPQEAPTHGFSYK